MDTATYLHRVDSSSSRRVIIVRQTSFKTKSTTSINTLNIDQNLQPLSTIVTSVATCKKRRKSLFNMRRRQAKDPSNAGNQRICTKENCLSCCKKFTAFMFSRVGLFFVMIGYVAFGGWLFQALEAQNEQDMRQSMSKKLNTTLYDLWAEILRVNSFPLIDKKGNFTSFATQQLEKFEETVISQVQQGFDGRTRPDADPDWNYFGAILYAVTLISTIGYGHITTKTIQGKIATILYSAFGIPLMMLFVANIGSTMAKMFAFVFSRVTMICCCQWKNKKRRKSLKARQPNNQTAVTLDEKTAIEKSTTKSNLKRTKDDKESIESTPSKPHFHTDSNSSPTSSANHTEKSTTESKQMPADVRLNMLTGVSSNRPKSRSSVSSTSTTGERPKDALARINELIRQNSVQDVESKIADDVFNDNDGLIAPNDRDKQQQRSDEMSPIQFYINETKKLTSNLENEQIVDRKTAVTNLDDDDHIQRVAPEITTTIKSETETKTKKSSKKKLKRSKSESSHNRKSGSKADSLQATDESEGTKSTRRRFFSRKLKKQPTLEDQTKPNNSLEQETAELFNKSARKLARKSQSFNDNFRSLPPPPDYEESTAQEITSLPSVTWKPDNELHPTKTKTTFDFPVHTHIEDDDELYEDEQMSVPLLVTVFVIPLYLTLGAILFNIWEKWGFLNSFYFCFITLTTIGFGDFVPGSSLTVSAAKEKLISAALYILLGLVLIAMCFNLMKEQLSQKVKQVAGKWGMSEL